MSDCGRKKDQFLWRKIMETILENNPAFSASKKKTDEASLTNPAYQAFVILRTGFTVAPILAGLDKFFSVLVNWDQYLPGSVNRILGGHGHEFMYAVGVVEIVAGIGVLLKPKLFAYVVALWLVLIIVNLLMIPGYFDVALRDLGLAIGAVALGRLSQTFSD